MPNRNPVVLNPPTTPRRSPRLLLQQNHTTPNPKSSNKPSIQSKTSTVRLRRSPRLNEQVPVSSLRRSPRISAKIERKIEEKSSKVSSPEVERKSEMKLSKVATQKVERKNEEKLREVSSRGSVTAKGRELKAEDSSRVTDEVVAVEGENKRKRKRGGGCEEPAKGWTIDQELALRKAYFTAKPSPHFWKNVSKLVPGKSQQDCFDRINHDFMTPPQNQPRSRAKTVNSSPIHPFSISASKLLIPTGKKVGKSNFLKPKSYIARKSIEKLLQHHLKVDQDREGDIFSVLEPNIDLSTNAMLPSQELCTPKQQKENNGLLQNCTERASSSSLSQKKSLSRFSGSGVQDLVSPPVLKKVKNRVLHEKYINQLRCREARRRATSARTQKSILGDVSNIQKQNIVKAAKDALVSEARDAISKFQQSQVNFMGNTCSDEDNDDDIGDECESQ